MITMNLSAIALGAFLDLNAIALGAFLGLCFIGISMILILIGLIAYSIYDDICDKFIQPFFYKRHLIKIFKESENKYRNFIINEKNYKIVHFLDNNSNNIINKDKKILKKFDNIYYYEFLSRCRYRSDPDCVLIGDILLKDNKIFLVLENTGIKTSGFCCPNLYYGYCLLLDKQKNKKFIDKFNRDKKFYKFNSWE